MTTKEKQDLIQELSSYHYDEDETIATFFILYSKGHISKNDFENLTAMILDNKSLSPINDTKE